MSKETNVIRYYVLCNKLKDVIRTGWKDWNVERKRVESIAEHIFGVQMLAIAMYSEYKYDIDISKVILMLAVHELEEIYIGDLTQFQISREEKEKLGREAVYKVLEGMVCCEEIAGLILEFDIEKEVDMSLSDEERIEIINSVNNYNNNYNFRNLFEKGIGVKEFM